MEPATSARTNPGPSAMVLSNNAGDMFCRAERRGPQRGSRVGVAIPLFAEPVLPVAVAESTDNATTGSHGHFTRPGVSCKPRVMFVIELVYKADLSVIDAHMAAHVKFLKKYYKSGNFLVSGRKVPRDGGIILAVGKTRAEIEHIIQEDPFHAHRLADFRVIEFRASQRADDIQERISRE